MKIKMENVVEASLAFAVAAHEGAEQVRKFTGEPYYVHPIGVADILRKYVPDCTDAQIAMAHLHDVVEDTKVKLSILYLMFGEEIGDGVDGLTDASKPSDGNRKQRKEIDALHTLAQPKKVREVKLCDCLHNLSSMKEGDPDFVKIWAREKCRVIFDPIMDDCHPALLAASREAFSHWNN